MNIKYGVFGFDSCSLG